MLTPPGGRCDWCPLAGMDPSIPSPATFDSPHWCGHARRGLKSWTAKYLAKAGVGPEPAGVAGRLVLRGYGDSSTGYGRLTARLLAGLEALGLPCAFSPIRVSEANLPLDPTLRARAVAGPVARPLLHVGGPAEPIPPRSVAFTMWETGRVSEAAVAALSLASCVVVPCAWNRDGFAASGVAPPIRVVPLGVDGSLYRPVDGEAPPPGDFVVLANARLTGGGHRKGADAMVRAFVDALGDRPDCRLVLKVFPDCVAPESSHPRVSVDRSAYDDAGMAAWYRRGSVYLTLAKSEGWGLTALEAMASGLPVVGPIHSGMAEYLTPACGYPVGFAPAPAEGRHYAGLGGWFEPSHESAVRMLRAAYRDPGREARGRAAACRAAEFPWERTARELAAIVRESGLAPARAADRQSWPARAASAAAAAADLLSGGRVSAEVVADREASCRACPYASDDARACAACSCGEHAALTFVGLDMALKRALPNQRCALKDPRWAEAPAADLAS